MKTRPGVSLIDYHASDILFLSKRKASEPGRARIFLSFIARLEKFGLFGDIRRTFGYDCRNHLSLSPSGSMRDPIDGRFRGVSASIGDLGGYMM